MNVSAKKGNSGGFVASSIVLVAIFFWTPAIDPFALTKLILIIFIALVLFPKVLFGARDFIVKEKFIFLLSICLLSLFLFQVFASDVLYVSLFGVQGRGSGALLYISVIIIFLALVIMARNSNLELVPQGLLILSALNGFYGVVQTLNVDPVNWGLVYEGIFGFYGNPNFMSTMTGLGVIIAVGLLFQSRSLTRQALLLIIIISSFVSLLGSASTQGWVVAALGLFPVLYLNMKKVKAGSEKILAGFYLIISILGSLALFNMGPIRSLLYQESIGFRFDFWRIAIRIISDNPWFGVGIDKFQNFYRLYKDADQVNRLGAEEFSDAAHNTYLHLAATGGIPLSALYLLLNLAILLRVLGAFKSGRVANTYAIYFGVWLGIQAQSLISVDQPAIVFLGWVVAGLLVGQSREVPIKGENASLRLASQSLGVLLLIPGLIFTIPVLGTQTKLQTAFYAYVAEGDTEAARVKADYFKEIEQGEPGNPIIPIYAANSLFIDRAYQQAAEAAERAIEIDGSDYRAWWFLASSLESIDRKSAIFARSETIRLSPLNVDDMLNQVKNYLAIEDLNRARSLQQRIVDISPQSTQAQEATSLIGE